MPNEEMGIRQMPEPPDVADATIGFVVAGYFLMVVAAMAGLFFYLWSSVPTVFRPPVEHSFPEPRLQIAPRDDLIRLEQAQRARLSGYGWVDQAHGLARIPIDEAMRIVAARGAQAYDPPVAAASPASPSPNGAGQ